jgi:hypothetical protein
MREVSEMRCSVCRETWYTRPDRASPVCPTCRHAPKAEPATKAEPAAPSATNRARLAKDAEDRVAKRALERAEAQIKADVAFLRDPICPDASGRSKVRH